MKYWHTIMFVLLVAQWCNSSESSNLNASSPITIPQKLRIIKTYAIYSDPRNKIHDTQPSERPYTDSSYHNPMFEHHENGLYSSRFEEGKTPFVTDGMFVWYQDPNNINE